MRILVEGFGGNRGLAAAGLPVRLLPAPDRGRKRPGAVGNSGRRAAAARGRGTPQRAGLPREPTERCGLGCHGAGRGRRLYPAGHGVRAGAAGGFRRRTMSRFLDLLGDPAQLGWLPGREG